MALTLTALRSSFECHALKPSLATVFKSVTLFPELSILILLHSIHHSLTSCILFIYCLYPLIKM